MNRKPKPRPEAYLDELGRDAGQLGSASGGQSGDTQSLDQRSEAEMESVGELAEEEQAFEAEVVSGVEEAAEHPERPVPSRSDPRPAHESQLPPDPDWK